MKTSVAVRLKFVSVFFWAQAKYYFTVHYFKKFGARDREDIEIEKRGKRERSTQHSEWQITTESEIPLTAPSLNAQPDRKKKTTQLLLEMLLYMIFQSERKTPSINKKESKQFQLCVCVCTQTSATWMNFEMSLQRSAIWHNSDDNGRTCSVVVSR